MLRRSTARLQQGLRRGRSSAGGTISRHATPLFGQSSDFMGRRDLLGKAGQADPGGGTCTLEAAILEPVLGNDPQLA
jgi:hypothetical protein